ncbi:ABC transporter ATP-binding protein [Lactobacillus xylocopicola]|uniref:ABC transporter ATP-binding protein n=1 Tax=Lactobacillus xylocopicola TaxID=2976676 RepID=A0ABM8BFU4_9LACO|nr:ABC transporter ATP-binding protein [Lactobacillus xylocopicola]BDR60119.1 ABC transporter ATP-binding protein [Lactobacillus xylocopicola]
MIEIKDLNLTLREPILKDANFSFQEGSIYLLHALNGTGKTSVLRTMVNLIAPNSGRVLFDGQKFAQVKQQVFYLETSDWFDKNLSGLDYLKFVKSEWQSEQDLNSAIERWEMGSYIKTPIRKYSLGMKQKLLVALYRVSDAKYLLMDEINNGLDADSRQVLYQELSAWAYQKKLIIMASHYQDEVENIVDETVTLDHRQLIRG